MALFTLGFISSCKKDSEGLTRLTYFPVFEYNEDITLVANGGSYTTGAVAKENGVEIPISVENNANFNASGLYEYLITATNSDGYSVSVTELVLVHNPAGAGTDVSGAIEDIGRPERTGVITLVQGTKNIYYCT
ncbi:MAG: hypothetical protein HC831_14250, partial [Chloroflexia bacterium]|nr:hypothetical protein [Chloroflexia bacterium]